MVGEDPVPESVHGLPKTAAAVAYAERKHEGQCRQADGAPFIVHPLEVASLLYATGAPDDVIAAGALHDTLEKTDATASDLATMFGARVAALVGDVTEDASIPTYAGRKAALRHRVANAGRDTLMIFAADKLSKTRELRLPGITFRRRRITHYRHCLELLQAQLPDCPLVTALETELATLPRRRPPRVTPTTKLNRQALPRTAVAEPATVMVTLVGSQSQ